MRGLPAAELALVLLAAACKAGPPAADGGDGAVADGGSPVVQLPKLPDWPCPAGWPVRRVAETTEVEHAICALPDQLACPAGQAQFPGETACRALGTACPAGDFLDEAALRALAPGFGGSIVYARPGGTGDGSRGAPAGSIAAALAAAADGDLVALAKGTFSEPAVLLPRVALIGACVEGTAIAPPSLGEAAGIVQFQGSGGQRLANLRVSGPSAGINVYSRQQPISLKAVEVSQARLVGLFVSPYAAGAEVEELVIRDTAAKTGGTAGLGALLSGGTIAMRRALFERNHNTGIAVEKPATVTLSDLVVRDTESDPSSKEAGQGLDAYAGTITIERALFERNRTAALSARNAGTRLVLRDLIVRDTRSEEATADDGIGLEVLGGASVSVERGLFERNRRAGVSITRTTGTPAPSLELIDAVIRDTQPIEQTGGAGMGLAVYSGAKASISRTLLEGNRHLGIFIGAELEGQRPSATLTDVAVLGTASNNRGQFGRGLEIEDGAPVTMNRLLLADNHEVGLFIGSLTAAGSYTIQDLVVRDTHAAACAGLPAGNPDRCVEGEVQLGGGSGVVVVESVTAELRSFEVARGAQCGLQVARNATLSARDGSVHDNPVGLSLPDETGDSSGILGPTVRFYANDANLSSAALPVPVAPAP